MVDLLPKDPEALLHSLLEYERSNGKFTMLSGDVVHSQWMHVNAQEYTKSVFFQLIVRDSKEPETASATIFREGIYISLRRQIQETSTLILCSTLFDAIQWHTLFKGVNLRILLLKSKRKTIPVSDVYIVPKQFFHLISHLKFFRIIFFYDFPNRSMLFERCKFSYSPTEFSLIYSWQFYQTFFLTFNRSNYIKPILIPLRHYEIGLFNFSCWTFTNAQPITTDTFHCPVCTELFTSILRLECLHNICLSCLRATYQIGHLTTCPICRASIINTNVVNVVPNKHVSKKTIEECLSAINIDTNTFIFREHGQAAEKQLLKNNKSFGYGKFPDCDQSHVSTCILIQERCPFSKEFLTSFFRAFFNNQRKIPLTIYIMYYDKQEFLIFDSFSKKYF
jgi:hypothetical protein